MARVWLAQHCQAMSNLACRQRATTGQVLRHPGRVYPRQKVSLLTLAVGLAGKMSVGPLCAQAHPGHPTDPQQALKFLKK